MIGIFQISNAFVTEIKKAEDGSLSAIAAIKGSNETVALNAPANILPENAALSVEKIASGDIFTKAQNALKDELNENSKLNVFEISVVGIIFKKNVLDA